MSSRAGADVCASAHWRTHDRPLRAAGLFYRAARKARQTINIMPRAGDLTGPLFLTRCKIARAADRVVRPYEVNRAPAMHAGLAKRGRVLYDGEKRRKAEHAMRQPGNKLNTIYISERVQERLRPARYAALTVLVAPMGYGKTTAVEWYLQSRERDAAAICVRANAYSDSVPLFWDGFAARWNGRASRSWPDSPARRTRRAGACFWSWRAGRWRGSGSACSSSTIFTCCATGGRRSCSANLRAARRRMSM